jgi:membrane-associated protein
MPFLPGDSLLFVAGALAGTGMMDYPLLVALLIAAAVAGNQTNYTIGSFVGARVFHWENSAFFNRNAFDRAHAFYEKYGGITLVLARFMPFLRTFAPFVAGVAQMTRTKFTFYDVTGGTLWVGSLVTAGYLFGNIGWVQTHLSKIIWALILVPGLIALYGGWRARRGAAS